MASNIIQLQTQRVLRSLYTQKELIRQFELDIFDFFKRTRQGHMERWEYWSADQPDDPAGGAAFWEDLVRLPGEYYLPEADVRTLHNAVHYSAVEATLQDIHTVVELGPGSPESVARKTLPFLRYAKHYIAVDQAAHQAEHAAQQVRKALDIPTSYEVADYLFPPIAKEGRPKTAFVMWGGSIGNIEGFAGTDPLPGLVRSLHLMAQNCNRGDVFFIGIDTETDEDCLTAAYNHPVLSRKFLSILFAAKKFGLIAGKFTPETWTHRSVWHPKTRQCAHYLFASEDQDFMIDGARVKIKAGEAFLTNNSYKFTPEEAVEAARIAGFSRPMITDDKPIGLLIARY